MGFFSALGSILGGPVGALAGAVLPSIIGGVSKKNSEKRQNEANVENTLLQLPRLRQSAEDAGFNPLTALMATGGQGFNVQTQHAPLASAEVIQNTVQDVGNVLSGEWSREKKRQEVVDDLNKINRDRATKADNTIGKTLAVGVRTPLPHRRSGMIGGGAGAVTMRPEPLQATSISTTPNHNFNPSTPYGPRVTPTLADPTKVMRDDGMTAANPDNPAEAEADWWTWAREGTFFQNVGEVWDRNVGERSRLLPKTIQSVKDTRAERAKEAEERDEKRKKSALKPVKPLRGHYGPAGSRTGF